MNKELGFGMGRNTEYYKELLPLAENLSVVTDENPGKSNLKISL